MEIMDCICAIPRVSTRHLCSEYVCEPLFAHAMKTAASWSFRPCVTASHHYLAGSSKHSSAWSTSRSQTRYFNWRKLAKTTHLMVLTNVAVIFWHSATVCQFSRLTLMVWPTNMLCNQAQVVNLCTIFSAFPVHTVPWQHTCSGRWCDVVHAVAGKSVLFFEDFRDGQKSRFKCARPLFAIDL